jgi:hypothetical protein
MIKNRDIVIELLEVFQYQSQLLIVLSRDSFAICKFVFKAEKCIVLASHNQYMLHLFIFNLIF